MGASTNDTRELQSLLLSASRGAEAARDRLIEHAAERLLRMTRMMLRNYPQLQRWEQTDDVFQNAMLRLHRSLAEVKPDSLPAFFGLAATQLRRTLIDMLRHHFGPHGQATHHHSDVGTGELRLIQRRADRDGRPETLEEWTAFHEAVENLSVDEREVFDLVWYAGMQQKEIAVLLQVSLPTVQRRWQRARLHLYEKLHGQSPAADEGGDDVR